MIFMIGSLLAAYLVIRTHHRHPLIWVHFKLDHHSQSCKSMLHIALSPIAVVLNYYFISNLYRYPQREFGKTKRSFNHLWYQQREWLEYSIERDAAFCFPCRIFGNRETSFTVVGFTSWNKATERFNSHVGTNSSAHHRCTISWKSFLLAQSKGV